MTGNMSSIKPASTESLENAAKHIDAALQSDRQYSELDILLKNARHAGGTLVSRIRVLPHLTLLCRGGDGDANIVKLT